MSAYRFSTAIAAPPERVFDLWTDVSRLHEWTEGISQVTDVTGTPGEAGSRYTVWFGRFASPTQVLESNRPHSVTTRFGNWLLLGEQSAVFEAVESGTTLTQQFRVHGVIPRIAARIFATGSYKGSFRGELEAFRKLAEQEPREGPADLFSEAMR